MARRARVTRVARGDPCGSSVQGRGGCREMAVEEIAVDYGVEWGKLDVLSETRLAENSAQRVLMDRALQVCCSVSTLQCGVRIPALPQVAENLDPSLLGNSMRRLYFYHSSESDLGYVSALFGGGGQKMDIKHGVIQIN